METFADRVIRFNKQLNFKGELPEGINIMNPFQEDEQALAVSSEFYRKYYSDTKSRYLILGINPGRFGAGVTGVPFTDPKRLIEKCGIGFNGKITHEPSSVFVYDVIDAYGGIEDFTQKFYVNAISPLGFTKTTESGKEVNYNFYDSPALTKAVYNFIIDSIQQMISLGINTDICYCLGNGKNEKFLRQLNQEQKFFKEIIGLEHPRFVMQYKTKSKQFYIDKYLEAFEPAVK